MVIKESLTRIKTQREFEVSSPYVRSNAVLNLSIGIAEASVNGINFFIIGMQGNPIYSVVDRNMGTYSSREIYALSDPTWKPIQKNSQLWEFLQNHFSGEADLPIPWENNRIRHVVVQQSSKYSVPTYIERPINLEIGILGETDGPSSIDGWWRAVATKDFDEFFNLLETVIQQKQLEQQHKDGTLDEKDKEILQRIQSLKLEIEKRSRETEKETLAFKSTLSSHENLTTIQNQAKFSNAFKDSNVVSIINGGAGTGKTTTVIQRLKYLLSPDDLKDRGVSLSPKQEELLNERNWRFFSPSDMLRQFLLDAMHHEGLSDAEEHSFVWKDYLNKVLADDYGALRGFSSVAYDNQPSRNVFLDAFKVLNCFKNGFINYAFTQLKEDAHDCFSSDEDRIINSFISKTPSNAVELCRICISLKDYTQKELENISEAIQETIDTQSKSLAEQLLDDINNLNELFRLRVPTGQQSGLIGEQINAFKKREVVSIELAIKAQLKQMSQYADWLPIDASLSDKDKITYRFVLNKIDSLVAPQIRMSLLQEQEYRNRHLAFLNNYFEKILTDIPGYYKIFRNNVSDDDISWNQAVLRELKNSNKIYQQEKSLILGFINKCCHAYFYAAENSFLNSSNKIVQAYSNNVFCIIGVDEATDYSLMDYFAIKSLMRPEKNVMTSFTLSGDFTQRLGYFFINGWDSLTGDNNWLFKSICLTELSTSFRQSRKLNFLAASLYNHLTGDNYPYKSAGLVNDVNPICFFDPDFNNRIDWLCEQIRVMKEKSDGKLFSTAVFTRDDDSAYRVYRELVNKLESIHIGRDRILLWPNLDMSIPDRIRILPISAVKGTEFPAVFLFDIDTLEDSDMAMRYLYVGVTRANLYFGVASSAENEYSKLVTENIHHHSWEE